MPPKTQLVACGLRLARARLKRPVANRPSAVATRHYAEPKAGAFGRFPPPSSEGESSTYQQKASQNVIFRAKHSERPWRCCQSRGPCGPKNTPFANWRCTLRTQKLPAPQNISKPPRRQHISAIRPGKYSEGIFIWPKKVRPGPHILGARLPATHDKPQPAGMSPQSCRLAVAFRPPQHLRIFPRRLATNRCSVALCIKCDTTAKARCPRSRIMSQNNCRFFT